jgi:hypothetical protein
MRSKMGFVIQQLSRTHAPPPPPIVTTATNRGGGATPTANLQKQIFFAEKKIGNKTGRIHLNNSIIPNEPYQNPVQHLNQNVHQPPKISQKNFPGKNFEKK